MFYERRKHSSSEKKKKKQLTSLLADIGRPVSSILDFSRTPPLLDEKC